MSGVRDDGGPAFPERVVVDASGNINPAAAFGFHKGITLRDYFAAKALSTCISLSEHRDGGWDEVAAAVCAYAVADAMLKARAAS